MKKASFSVLLCRKSYKVDSKRFSGKSMKRIFFCLAVFLLEGSLVYADVPTKASYSDRIKEVAPILEKIVTIQKTGMTQFKEIEQYVSTLASKEDKILFKRLVGKPLLGADYKLVKHLDSLLVFKRNNVLGSVRVLSLKPVTLEYSNGQVIEVNSQDIEKTFGLKRKKEVAAVLNIFSFIMSVANAENASADLAEGQKIERKVGFLISILAQSTPGERVDNSPEEVLRQSKAIFKYLSFANSEIKCIKSEGRYYADFTLEKDGMSVDLHSLRRLSSAYNLNPFSNARVELSALTCGRNSNDGFNRTEIYNGMLFSTRNDVMEAENRSIHPQLIENECLKPARKKMEELRTALAKVTDQIAEKMNVRELPGKISIGQGGRCKFVFDKITQAPKEQEAILKEIVSLCESNEVFKAATKYIYMDESTRWAIDHSWQQSSEYKKRLEFATLIKTNKLALIRLSATLSDCCGDKACREQLNEQGIKMEKSEGAQGVR